MKRAVPSPGRPSSGDVRDARSTGRPRYPESPPAAAICDYLSFLFAINRSYWPVNLLSHDDIRTRSGDLGKTTAEALIQQAGHFTRAETAAFVKDGHAASVNI